VLLVCTALALAAANSRFAEAWHAFFHLPVALRVGGLSLDWTLHHWINDALMAVFFFVVGLEIKREFAAGELSDPKKAALPIAAALGGMVVPAAIYLWLQLGRAGERGWGIPMATDIAFVVGCMALLGPRVPHGLKILILALAIVDDIGAIVVIALGYSAGIEPGPLAAAALGFGLCALLDRVGVRAVGAYLAIGAGIWLAFVLSGLHPTVAGVLLGLLTPASAFVAPDRFGAALARAARELRERASLPEEERRELARALESAARESVSPLERLEGALHPWVAFGIMPLFALANAGVRIEASELLHPVGVAVAAGLVLGKPIGILLASALFVKLGLARLPAGVGWPALAGGGCLAGIGFTMALFIAGLALEGELLDAAKIGILGGSLVSVLLGALLLAVFLPRPVGAAEARAGAPPA
jgi:NhaA family Na+:H+ antiporter